MKHVHLFLSVLLALFVVTVQHAQAVDPAPAASNKPWNVRCNKDDKGKEITEPKRGNCEIFQRLVVKESGKRFVEAAIGFPKDKSTARGIFIVPLGVLLQPGMTLKIDDGKEFKFQARYCDGSGCFGFVDLNDALLDSMRKGTKLTVTFQALNKKSIGVELTLKDFAAALKDIS